MYALKWVESFASAGADDPRVWLVTVWSTLPDERVPGRRPRKSEHRASWSAEQTEALTFETERDALDLRDCVSGWSRSVEAVKL